MPQEQIQARIDELVASGAELGVQVAAYQHGELVVDAVAGPMAPDTLCYAASTGKGASATVANVLVERGVLAYDRPVAEVWPEFGAHGKSGVTLRHILTHSAGLPALPDWTTIGDLTDWDTMAAAMADAKPWWEPGTKTAYHAQTFGFLVGEVVRRATGRTISEVLREILEPLGIADEVYFGVPADQLHRVVPLVEAPGVAEAQARFAELFAQFAPIDVQPSAEYGNRPDVLQADIPSGGTMSARGIAKLYAALLGEVDGTRLVRPETLELIAGPALVGIDELLGNPATWALGYLIGRLGSTPDRTPDVFGMPGVGGSVGWADRRHGISFGLTRNRFDPSSSQLAVDLGALVAESLT